MKEHNTMEKIKKLIGTEQGQNQTWFKIIDVIGEGLSKTFPSIKDGVKLHWGHPEYWEYKTVIERNTIQIRVMGNGVSCESFLQSQGFDCYNIAHGIINIFTD